MSKIREEISRKVPRLTMSLIIAIIFFAISLVVPETVSSIQLPGIDVPAGTIIQIVTIVITAVFLIRALSDALFLGDIVTDIIVRRIGIKEERSPKRAARDLIYIIIIILIATAVLPFIRMLKNDWLTVLFTYTALGLIIILIYDIGRILYRIVEQRAESLADRLSKMAVQDENGE